MMAVHHQVKVAPGGTIRAKKTWRNIGGAGYRDILVAYGKATSPDGFSAEHVQLGMDRYAGAGAQVTTIIDTRIAEVLEPGLRDALVAVGKYDVATSIFADDDYEIILDAIEIVSAPIGSFSLIQQGLPGGTEYWVAWWITAERGATANLGGWRGISEALRWQNVPLFGELSIAGITGGVPTYYPSPGVFFGPFIMEDGKIYQIDVNTGELTMI